MITRTKNQIAFPACDDEEGTANKNFETTIENLNKLKYIYIIAILQEQPLLTYRTLKIIEIAI